MEEASALRDGGSVAYLPAAIYYEEADSVEYVRRDVPNLHRRIDRTLTLVFDLEIRELLGFRLKGFKNFYNRCIRPKVGDDDQNFINMIVVLEELIGAMGNEVIDEPLRAKAYQAAHSMADQDRVQLRDFPNAA